MKYLLLLLLLLPAGLQAQIDLQNTINSIQNSLGTNVSNDKVVRGLKEALEVGIKNASGKASKTDGYYKNPLIKIPFPKEAQQVKSTLNNLGMKKQVSDFEKQLNRAAEDAAKKALPVFGEAIKKMTIQDGLSILKGRDDEATRFLQKNSTAGLEREFKPIVAQSLKKVKISQYWKPLASTYNKIPLVEKVNPDLEAYVTDKAIEGLFKMVALEEKKIRDDPAARVTSLLQEVFGKK